MKTILIALLIAVCTTSYCQNNQRVSLDVKSDNALVESYLLRGFRSLGDVDVVDEDETFQINVVTHSMQGTNVFVVQILGNVRMQNVVNLSLAEKMNFPNNYPGIELDLFRGEDIYDLFENTVRKQKEKNGSSIVEPLGLHLLSKDEMLPLCQEVVALIDVEYFEKQRKLTASN